MDDITSWLNAPWVNTLAGAMIGAIVGGGAGYAFSQHQRQQETVAKRVELAKALMVELSFIGGTVPPYKVEKAFYRDPIHLSTLQLLLDGGTLEFRSHEAAINSLLFLQAAIRTHNDLVRTTNIVQNVAAVPDTAHAQMYADMVQRLSSVLVARAEVLKYLPSVIGSQVPEKGGHRRWLRRLSWRKVGQE